MDKTIIYPGTFDPFTNGHLGIIKRARLLFDHIIVAVAKDNAKNPLFTLAERVDLVEKSLALTDVSNVLVKPFSGLLMDYAKQHNAIGIVRGLRAVSDFDYEFQMALMNRKLNSEIQTFFLMSDYRWMYISSSNIKNVASLAGDVRSLVPIPVLDALRNVYKHPANWPQSSSNSYNDSSSNTLDIEFSEV